MRREIIAGQIRQCKVVAPEIALKGKRLRSENGPIRKPPLRDENRQERRLPAIRQKNFRRRVHATGQLDGGLCEIDETRGVVLIVAPINSIEPGTIKILVSRNQEDLHTLRSLSLENVDGDARVANLNVEFDTRLLRLSHFPLPNAAVIGNHDADLVS